MNVDIENILKTKHQSLPWLTEGIVYLSVAGSHAYGLASETSDIDIKGIAIPPERYFLGFLHRFDQAESKNPDMTIYGIHKFFQLAADCNPNIIEILWTDESDIIEMSNIGSRIRWFRDSFLSQKAKYTFSGYAHAQLKKMRSVFEGIVGDKPTKTHEFFLRKIHLHPVHEFVNPLDIVRSISLGTIDAIERSRVLASLGVEQDRQPSKSTKSVLTLVEVPELLGGDSEVPSELGSSSLNETKMNAGELSVSPPGTDRRTAAMVRFVPLEEIGSDDSSSSAYAPAMSDKVPTLGVSGDLLDNQFVEPVPNFTSTTSSSSAVSTAPAVLLESIEEGKIFLPAVTPDQNFIAAMPIRMNAPIGDSQNCESADPLAGDIRRAYDSASTHNEILPKTFAERKHIPVPIRRLNDRERKLFKHAMHLVRLMRMCREILADGKVIVKRPDREELLAIRNGAWSYDELIEWADKQNADMNELLKISPLPRSADRVYLDSLCRQMVKESLGIEYRFPLTTPL